MAATKRWKRYTTQTCDSFLFTTAVGSPTHAQNIHRSGDEGMRECVWGEGAGSSQTKRLTFVAQGFPSAHPSNNLSCTVTPLPPYSLFPLPLASSPRFLHHRRDEGGFTSSTVGCKPKWNRNFQIQVLLNSRSCGLFHCPDGDGISLNNFTLLFSSYLLYIYSCVASLNKLPTSTSGEPRQQSISLVQTWLLQ